MLELMLEYAHGSLDDRSLLASVQQAMDAAGTLQGLMQQGALHGHMGAGSPAVALPRRWLNEQANGMGSQVRVGFPHGQPKLEAMLGL